MRSPWNHWKEELPPTDNAVEPLKSVSLSEPGEIEAPWFRGRRKNEDGRDVALQTDGDDGEIFRKSHEAAHQWKLVTS